MATAVGGTFIFVTNGATDNSTNDYYISQTDIDTQIAQLENDPYPCGVGLAVIDIGNYRTGARINGAIVLHNGTDDDVPVRLEYGLADNYLDGTFPPPPEVKDWIDMPDTVTIPSNSSINNSLNFVRLF